MKAWVKFLFKKICPGDQDVKVGVRKSSGKVLYQAVQFEYSESHHYELFQLEELMSIEDQKVFAITQADNFYAVGIFTAEMSCKIDPIDLGAQGEELAKRKPHGLFAGHQEEATLSVALEGSEVTCLI